MGVASPQATAVRLGQYLEGLQAHGPVAIVGGHYTWPGVPDSFALDSAESADDAARSLGLRPTIFLNDIGAASCGLATCGLSPIPTDGPRPPGTHSQPAEAAEWLERLPELVAAARRGNDWQGLAMEVDAHLVPAEARHSAPLGWLLRVEESVYRADRRRFLPLLLMRALDRELPGVLFERTVLNGATRSIHRIHKRGLSDDLQVEHGEDGQTRYVLRFGDETITLRHESRLRGSATTCAGIIAHLYYRLIKSMVDGEDTQEASVVYLVPAFDRARLRQGIRAFQGLYPSLLKGVGLERVRLSQGVYTSRSPPRLLIEETRVDLETRYGSRSILAVSPGTPRGSQAIDQDGAPSLYLDHNATTPVDPRVLDRMTHCLTETYGNPSSAHEAGWRAELAMEEARHAVATLIRAQPDEIIFTSGATEANNWVMQGLARQVRTVYASKIEHKSVLEPIMRLSRQGIEWTPLPVDQDGAVSVPAECLTPKSLVSVMGAHNEIHTLTDLEPIGRACRGAGAFFHTDAVQALGAVDLDVERLGVDVASFSSHKIHGPKGVGALFVSRRIRGLLEPLLVGGGQEQGLRAGTQAVSAIVGFGEACRILATDGPAERIRLRELAADFLDQLCTHGVRFRLVGPPDLSLRKPGCLALILEGVVAARFSETMRDLAISHGSACTTNSGSSHVLEGLGLSAQASGFLRVAFGRQSQDTDPAEAARHIREAVGR